jgi:hypothetical protein
MTSIIAPGSVLPDHAEPTQLPKKHLAPLRMAWEGLSAAQIYQLMFDPKRGGLRPDQFVAHIETLPPCLGKVGLAQFTLRIASVSEVFGFWRFPQAFGAAKLLF